MGGTELGQLPSEILDRIYDRIDDKALFFGVGLVSKELRLSVRGYLRRSSRVRWRGVGVRTNGVRSGLREVMSSDLSLLVNVSITLSAFDLVTDGGRQSVWEALGRNRVLRALRILFIRSDETVWVAENLLDRVEQLELYCGFLGEAGARALAQRRGGRLRELGLGSCDVGGKVAEILFSDTPNTEQCATPGAQGTAIADLCSLSLTMCPLRDGGARALGRCRFPRLEKLSIENCDVGDAGLVTLAPKNLPKLAVLDLAENRLGAGSTDVLESLCRNCPSLRTLRLNYNRLGDAGTAYLSGLDLTALGLRHCLVGEEGCESLARSTTLKSIDLCGNKQVEGRGIAAGGGLQSLEVLLLDNCGVNDDGALAIASGSLRSLKSLSLRGSLISRLGVLALANGKLSALRKLVLQGNFDDPKSTLELLMMHLPTLNTLNILPRSRQSQPAPLST